MSTMRRLRPLVGVIASAALILGATSCSTDLADRFRPHPTEDDAGQAGSVEYLGDAGQQDGHDRPPPRALRPDRDDDPYPGSVVPQTLSPDGVDVTLTQTGTELDFGESATVTTGDREGRLLVWTVTVREPEVRATDQVSLVDPDAAAGVELYQCILVDLTYLGIDNSDSGGDILAGVPSPQVAVNAPEVVPLSAELDPVPQVIGGADANCGVAEADRLPVAEQDLSTGRDYVRATLGTVHSDGSPAETARFDYRDALRPAGGGDVPRRPKPVYWG